MSNAVLQNLEAEQAVLGSLLRWPETIAEAKGLIEAADFYKIAHGRLYETILRLAEEGAPVDTISLSDSLKQEVAPMGGTSLFEFIGGYAYLSVCLDVPASEAHIGHYCRLLKDHALRRQGIQRLKEAYKALAFNKLVDGTPLEDGLDYIRKSNGYFHFSQLLQAPDAGSHVVSMEDVVLKGIEWLYPGYIPFGMITLIQGDPGVGKGVIGAELASRLSQGTPMPLLSMKREPVKTLLLVSAEEDLERTTKGKLTAADADMRFIKAYDDVPEFPEATDRLARDIRHYGVRLVIIDPLNAYIASGINAYSDKDMRKALAPLKRVAEETGAAIILVHHMNKMTTVTSAMHRASGTIAIPGVARSVLMVADHPNMEGKRVLAPVKNNLGPRAPSLLFSIEGVPVPVGGKLEDYPRIVWEGVCEMTCDDLLQESSEKRKTGKALSEAVEFYREALEGGERESAEVEEERGTAGISDITGQRARSDLKVVSRRKGFGPGSKVYLSLPIMEQPPPILNHSQDDTKTMIEYGENDGVWASKVENVPVNPPETVDKSVENPILNQNTHTQSSTVGRGDNDGVWRTRLPYKESNDTLCVFCNERPAVYPRAVEGSQTMCEECYEKRKGGMGNGI